MGTQTGDDHPCATRNRTSSWGGNSITKEVILPRSPPPSGARLVFLSDLLILYLYPLPPPIESHDREESEENTDASIRCEVEDLLWGKHHDSTYQWEHESIECWSIVFILIIPEKAIEVGFWEIHGSSEEEPDEKC